MWRKEQGKPKGLEIIFISMAGMIFNNLLIEKKWFTSNVPHYSFVLFVRISVIIHEMEKQSWFFMNRTVSVAPGNEIHLCSIVLNNSGIFMNHLIEVNWRCWYVLIDDATLIMLWVIESTSDPFYFFIQMKALMLRTSWLLFLYTCLRGKSLGNNFWLEKKFMC